MAKMTSGDLKAFTYHYPRSAVIITARYNDKENAMTAAWHMPVSDKPPMYAVSIAPRRFTYQLITGSKRFGVNFLPFEKAELLAAVGGSSGRDINKFDYFGIQMNEAEVDTVPVLNDAYAAYECRLVDDTEFGDHRLLVGEIMRVHWLDEVYGQNVVINLEKINPILYLGKDIYVSTAKDTRRQLNRKIYGVR
ncbi:flavin reductase family protein [Chloroflexota bacterium]